MDPRRNPYSPGAGSQPLELAGRGELVTRAEIALDRIRAGRAARSFILYGLRGVGKTVLLNRIRLDAEARGFASVAVEAPEGRSLPGVLIPALRAALVRLSAMSAGRAAFEVAMKALAGFARAFKVKFHDIEIAMDVAPKPGLADSGDLDFDLADLFKTIGQAAKKRELAVVLYLDELQYVAERQLAALITALHSVAQDQLPLTMVAAGLPQLAGQMGRAKSYAERLFEFYELGPLDDAAARTALTVPAAKEGATYDDAALVEILAQTQGYPYFLQEWGKHAWDIAARSPIRGKDAKLATVLALAELDASFFRVRFDRLTPSEKQYLQAMAALGPGAHRSGDIADRLGKKVSTVAPVRANLIAKGMAYSPAHGDTAFTVPLFDAFMKRIMGGA
ncbi:AAA family ATPase [Methylovirgula sp. 4M-Z18]|uniref:AAA family ATPase n=1 Tax=Methylovirgula sp. 4M-Z18 TaxID=2293567 RepID=UPI000E2F2D98|nr:ATP-binding protein [Methylovirgula sp. 4M-Z18]RFB79997.1 ATP-binding protein [Methylovirgula sp. 4M-Z18]